MSLRQSMEAESYSCPARRLFPETPMEDILRISVFGTLSSCVQYITPFADATIIRNSDVSVNDTVSSRSYLIHTNQASSLYIIPSWFLLITIVVELSHLMKSVNATVRL